MAEESLAGKAVLTGAIVVWMLVAAVRNRPRGLLNWPMFTRTCCLLVDLQRISESGPVPVNPYQHLPSHAPQMTPRDFDLLLQFLRAEHPQERIEGTGVFYGSDRDLLIKVIDGHVVVKGIREQFRDGHR